jgi:hypothetical protein
MKNQGTKPQRAAPKLSVHVFKSNLSSHPDTSHFFLRRIALR